MLLRIGIKKAQRQPTETHPYGYARDQFIWPLISAVGIFCCGAGVSFVHGVTGLFEAHREIGDLYWNFVGESQDGWDMGPAIEEPLLCLCGQTQCLCLQCPSRSDGMAYASTISLPLSVWRSSSGLTLYSAALAVKRPAFAMSSNPPCVLWLQTYVLLTCLLWLCLIMQLQCLVCLECLKATPCTLLLTP